jgi:hypothetical protein
METKERNTNHEKQFTSDALGRMTDAEIFEALAMLASRQSKDRIDILIDEYGDKANGTQN